MKSSKMSKGRNASKKVGNHCFTLSSQMLMPLMTSINDDVAEIGTQTKFVDDVTTT